jgi:hypothetical protein
MVHFELGDDGVYIVSYFGEGRNYTRVKKLVVHRQCIYTMDFASILLAAPHNTKTQNNHAIARHYRYKKFASWYTFASQSKANATLKPIPHSG